MDTRVLEYFIKVAEQESITRAAQLLHLSQPTLSRQISALEEEIGVKLFNRTKYKVTLTRQGILFKRRAEELLILLQKSIDEARQVDSELSGILRVGCGEFSCVNELTIMIANFQKLHPNVNIILHNTSRSEIEMGLTTGVIDMGLVIAEKEPNDNCIVMKKKEEIGILVREDHELACYDTTTPEKITKYPVINITNEMIDIAEQIWDIDWSQFRGTSYNLLYNAAITCKNIGLPVVCARLDYEYAGLKFIPFEPKLEISTQLKWKEHKIASRVLAAFVAYLKEQYSNENQVIKFTE